MQTDRFRTIETGRLGFATVVEDRETGEVFESPLVWCDSADEEEEVLQGYVFDSVCEAIDGSAIEPDGVTYDGYPSWLLYWGLV